MGHWAVSGLMGEETFAKQDTGLGREDGDAQHQPPGFQLFSALPSGRRPVRAPGQGWLNDWPGRGHVSICLPQGVATPGRGRRALWGPLPWSLLWCVPQGHGPLHGL